MQRKNLLQFIQITNHQTSFLKNFVSFLQSQNAFPSICKTALDDFWAYLSILRVIIA
jgi:hypothetical protein